MMYPIFTNCGFVICNVFGYPDAMAGSDLVFLFFPDGFHWTVREAHILGISLDIDHYPWRFLPCCLTAYACR